MRALKDISTGLELWRTMRPFLPEAVQDMRVEKITIKFTLSPKNGTLAEAHTVVVLNGDKPYERSTKLRKDRIMDAYGLYESLKAKISNFPYPAQKMDIIMDPNKGTQIKATMTPIVQKESVSNGKPTA